MAFACGVVVGAVAVLLHVWWVASEGSDELNEEVNAALEREEERERSKKRKREAV